MKEISSVHSQANFHRPTQTQPPEQTDDTKRAMNPAKAARAALVDRPDLAGKPFGHLVSLFARGLPLPVSEIPAAPSSETETTDTSGTSGEAPEVQSLA
jgi:hypothetical protein